MLRNKLVRSDGSIIDSSVIISCEYTEAVNSGKNLTVGDVTASEITVEIRSTDLIQQDEVLTYSIIEDDVETQIGVFKVEKPTKATRSTMRFSAYDNVAKTEKVFSDWLRENQHLFPMNLGTLVEYACSSCEVTLVTTDFPHADLLIKAFYADDITCRQIISWAAAIAGRFVRANAEGQLEFAWYSEYPDIIVAANPMADSSFMVNDNGYGNVSVQSKHITITDDGEGNVTLVADGLSVVLNDDSIALTSIKSVIQFLSGKLSYESYTTDSIERVQIKNADNDSGVIYPEEADGNCFGISGNMILGTVDGDEAARVAESLYDELNGMTYVPFSVTIPRTMLIRAGDKIGVVDADGNAFETYVMKVSSRPGGTTLSASGDKSYGSSAAVSSKKYTNLTGKVLSLAQSVNGLEVKNADLEGQVSGLRLTTNEIRTYVEKEVVSGESFEKYKSEVIQTAQEMTARFDSLDQYRRQTQGYIRTGEVDKNEDGTPLIGLEIGQQSITAEGGELFNKYARFTSKKLSFFDSSANEVTQIGGKKMAVTNIEITGSFEEESEERGTFKHGNFVDFAQPDGSIISKWIGGN